MNKFTIFTVILAISVVTVTADLALRDYVSKTESQASVLDEEISPVIETMSQPQADSEQSERSEQSARNSDEQDAAVPEFPLIAQTPLFESLLTPKIISEAGFTGVVTEEQFSGKVYKLLDITKIPIEGVDFYEIAAEGVPVASVAEIGLKDEIRALQLYILLQNKTKPYIDLSLNETNAYGDRSFYINHAKKPEEAFLTVKIGSKIYAFAYVKSYHPQIKKLLEFLGSLI